MLWTATDAARERGPTRNMEGHTTSVCEVIGDCSAAWTLRRPPDCTPTHPPPPVPRPARLRVRQDLYPQCPLRPGPQHCACCRVRQTSAKNEMEPVKMFFRMELQGVSYTKAANHTVRSELGFRKAAETLFSDMLPGVYQSITFEVPDDVFKDVQVTLSDFASVPAGTVVNVITHAAAEGKCTERALDVTHNGHPTVRSSTPVSVTPNATAVTDTAPGCIQAKNLMDVLAFEDGEDEVEVEHLRANPYSHVKRKFTPLTCGLPEFSSDLLRAMGKTGVPLTSTMKNRLVVALHGHMTKWVTDCYPTSEEYDHILGALYRRFPHLQGKANERLGTKKIPKRMDSIRCSLQRRWKYARRDKMDKAVSANKAKYGSKAPTRMTKAETLCYELKKLPVDPDLPCMDPHETRASLEDSRKRIERMWIAVAQGGDPGDIRDMRNNQQFTGLWENTKCTRRHYCLSTEDKWAALLLEAELQLNVHDPRAKALRFVRQKGCRANMLLRLHEICNMNGQTAKRCRSYRARIRSMDTDTEADLRVFIACLPFLAKENALTWIQFLDEEPEDTTVISHFGPVVVAVPSAATGKYHGEGSSFIPYFYGEAVCSERNLDMVDAFIILVCVMYLSGYEFGKTCPNSWRALSEVILRFPERQRPMTEGYARLLECISDTATVNEEWLKELNSEVSDNALNIAQALLLQREQQLQQQHNEEVDHQQQDEELDQQPLHDMEDQLEGMDTSDSIDHVSSLSSFDETGEDRPGTPPAIREPELPNLDNDDMDDDRALQELHQFGAPNAEPLLGASAETADVHTETWKPAHITQLSVPKPMHPRAFKRPDKENVRVTPCVRTRNMGRNRTLGTLRSLKK
ncbi:Sterile alpha motif domain-containing protein 3 [Frankliniella fusca]|uniref:Sterile alpha motif domain-containing protein 3 n=1 Tax=Frankliniella fusca TaxID=407009 RepID=A0AAE1LV55_9NEOP|nr:Sterile alpha motif domain-containing protein 3 [Frankliniella fusca]